MSIICAICGKKQSGWIEDYPLYDDSTRSNIRICAVCQDHLLKLKTTKDQNIINSESEYLEEKTILFEDILPDVKKTILDIIDLKKQNHQIDITEILKDEHLQYEKKKNIQLEHQIKEVMLTTGYGFEGYKILKSIDVIFEEKIVGIGIKTNLKSIGDIFSSLTGDEMYAITDRIRQLKNKVKIDLKAQAISIGANAIIGIDFETTFPGTGAIMVSLNGTAVLIEKI